jgi:hypothetical protein
MLERQGASLHRLFDERLGRIGGVWGTMDARKPSKGNNASAQLTRPRNVVAAALLLALIVGRAYTILLRTEPRVPDVTTALASSSGRSAPHASNQHGIVPPAVHLRPVGAKETESACYAALRDAGVAYQSVSSADAGAIAWPIKLAGPVDGVRVHGNGNANAPTNYLDCRLARTLLTWAPLLREKGVVGIEHYSMYRPESVVGNSSKPSGHVLGRAIDVAKFEMSDGRTLSVLNDWTNRARGADPCQTWPDDEAGKLMRQLVCEAAARGLFQIVVTPHYNDTHGNHVHLEIDPQGGSLWIR